MILIRFSLKYQSYLVYVYSLNGNISYLLIIYYNIDPINMVQIFRIIGLFIQKYQKLKFATIFILYDKFIHRRIYLQWIKQGTMVIEKIYHESKSTCAFSKLLLICD